MREDEDPPDVSKCAQLRDHPGKGAGKAILAPHVCFLRRSMWLKPRDPDDDSVSSDGGFNQSDTDERLRCYLNRYPDDCSGT